MGWAGETAQQVRAFAAIEEDPGSNPSIYRGAHSHL